MDSTEVSFSGILEKIEELAGVKNADLRKLVEENIYPKFGILDRPDPFRRSDGQKRKILTEIEFCFSRSGEFRACDTTPCVIRNRLQTSDQTDVSIRAESLQEITLRLISPTRTKTWMMDLFLFHRTDHDGKVWVPNEIDAERVQTFPGSVDPKGQPKGRR